MSTENQEKFISYLDQRTEAVQADTARLIEDHRSDEANFEKIRANIFQIIKTLFMAKQKLPESEKETFMQSRLALFKETWNASLVKAQTHDDQLRVQQELVKLEALEEIRNHYEQLQEVED